MDPTPQPDGRGRAPRSPRAGAGRLLVVVVAAGEAVVAALAAVGSLLSGTRDGSLVLAAAVAGVAGGVAYLLAEVARGLAHGRRWPTGIFVTVQLLVALVALSLGGRSLLTAADNPRIALLTVAAVALAGAGLLGIAWVASGRAPAEPDEPPPVF